MSTHQISVGRDIPLPLVTSGCENSGNLRELALNRMKDFGAECRDVRFREVGVCLFWLPILTCSASPFKIDRRQKSNVMLARTQNKRNSKFWLMLLA